MVKHKNHHDHWRRSLTKSITYRLAVIFMIFVVSKFITKDTKQALEITGWNAILATIVYYIHERAWSRIRWGRN